MKMPVALRSEPGVRTSSRRTFSSLAVLLILSYLFTAGVQFAYVKIPGLSQVVDSHWYLAEGSSMVLRACLWIAVAFAFTGNRSPVGFLGNMGFLERVHFRSWLFAWAGVALGFLDLYFVMDRGMLEHASASYFYSGGKLPWTFYVVCIVLLGPFSEELVMRGFLYPALRASYGLIVSIVVVCCVGLYFHWSLFSQAAPFISLIILITSSVTLCLIREYTYNTWGCVLFHGAYNATVLREWALCLVSMTIVLLLCRRAEGASSPTFSPECNVTGDVTHHKSS